MWEEDIFGPQAKVCLEVQHGTKRKDLGGEDSLHFSWFGWGTDLTWLQLSLVSMDQVSHVRSVDDWMVNRMAGIALMVVYLDSFLLLSPPVGGGST